MTEKEKILRESIATLFKQKQALDLIQSLQKETSEELKYIFKDHINNITQMEKDIEEHKKMIKEFIDKI